MYGVKTVKPAKVTPEARKAALKAKRLAKRREKKQSRGESSTSLTVLDLQVDVWSLIVQYLHPKDVVSLAAVSRQARWYAHLFRLDMLVSNAALLQWKTESSAWPFVKSSWCDPLSGVTGDSLLKMSRDEFYSFVHDTLADSEVNLAMQWDHLKIFCGSEDQTFPSNLKIRLSALDSFSNSYFTPPNDVLAAVDTLEWVDKLRQYDSFPFCNLRHLSVEATLYSRIFLTGLPLETLKLSCCQQLSVLADLSDLKALTSLTIEHCPSLTSLPAESLLNLKHISVKDAKLLQGINCSGLSLQSLEVKDCPALCMTLSRTMPQLKALHADAVESIRFESLQVPVLQSLRISQCELRSLAGIETANRTLEIVALDNCLELQSFDEFKRLGALEHLHLKQCGITHLHLDGVMNRQLQSITLEDCTSLCELPDMKGFSALRKLRVSNSPSLEAVPTSLFFLPQLEDLQIVDCTNLKTTSPTTSNALESIRRLSFSHRPFSRDVMMQETLTELTLMHVKGMREFPIDLSMPTLASLSLVECNDLVKLPDHMGAAFPQLKHLNLSGLQRLRGLPDTWKGCQLQCLKITSCHRVHELPEGLGQATWIETIECRDCRGLSNIANSLGKLAYFKRFVACDCRDLGSVSHLRQVRVLLK